MSAVDPGQRGEIVPRRFWKLARPDGTPFTGSGLNYREAIGQWVEPREPLAPPQLCSASVLHAVVHANLALSMGATWPCSLFEVRGEPVIERGGQYGFKRLYVAREIVSDFRKRELLHLPKRPPLRLRRTLATLMEKRICDDDDRAVFTALHVYGPFDDMRLAECVREIHKNAYGDVKPRLMSDQEVMASRQRLEAQGVITWNGSGYRAFDINQIERAA